MHFRIWFLLNSKVHMPVLDIAYAVNARVAIPQKQGEANTVLSK